MRQSRSCQKEKEQSHQSRLTGREMGENQGEQEPHLGDKEEGQSGSMEERISSTEKMGFEEGREGKQREPS